MRASSWAAAGGAQLGEQPAPPDRLELAGVADQDEPPVVVLGEVDELVQGAGAEHAGLVDDHRGRRSGAGSGGRGAGRRRVHSWSSLATVSVSMPVSSARTWAALAVGATPNTVRPWRRRSSTARRSMVVLPVPAGPTTTTSRSCAGDRRGGVGLEDVEPVPVDGGRRCRVVELGVDGPGQDPFLLGQDRRGGVVGAVGFQPHRPAIRRPAAAGAVGSRLTHCSSTSSGDPLERRRPLPPRHAGQRRGQVADRPQHVGPGPGRPDGGELIEDLLDGHRRLGVGCS